MYRLNDFFQKTMAYTYFNYVNGKQFPTKEDMYIKTYYVKIPYSYYEVTCER
jgi:hypothetical protein